MIYLVQLGRTDYATGLQLQRSLVALRKQQKIGDVLLLLEHSPVITMGRNARDTNLLASREVLAAKGVDFFETDRGGDVTFHGPGQLVGYPIFDLRRFSPPIGAVEFVRRIEEALIRALGEYGVPCSRVPGMTGVWISSSSKLQEKPASSRREAGLAPHHEGGKIAAIGIHISGGITSHGFALNVAPDLNYFHLIVACGLSGRTVTSLEKELPPLGRPIPSLEEIGYAVSRNFGKVFGLQVLHLESLDELLTFRAAGTVKPQEHPTKGPVIDDRLRIPSELKQLPHHRHDFENPLGTFQEEDDKSSLA